MNTSPEPHTMNTSPEPHTLRDYLRVLRRRRLLIVACVVIAAGAALAYSLVKTPRYEATASISFNDESAGLQAVGLPPAPDFAPANRASRGARVVTRDDVVKNVQKALKTTMTPDQLRASVTAVVDTESNLVRVTGTSEDAKFAARVANAFAEQTKAVLTEEDRAQFKAAAADIKDRYKDLSDDDQVGIIGQSYNQQISRLLGLGTLSEPVDVNDAASVPGTPASPKPIRDTIIAAILGLLIGIGAAFLRDSLDRRITEPHAAQRQFGWPLLGYVHHDALGHASISKNGDREASDEMEAFRILRANFGFLAKEREVRSVVITSALPEEGKSTVAFGLAYASALAGRRTLLVDCDFRRPVLAERLGVATAPGLSDHLEGDAQPAEILHSIPVEGGETRVLVCITAGSNLLRPTETLGSPAFGKFLEQVTRAYDLVVLDTAPVLPVSDTLELLPKVDAALFCVRLGQTTSDQAENARAALEHLPDQPTGLVVTGLKRGADDDYYGYYSSPSSESKATSTG